jgi:hypothetical protein
MQRKGGKKIGRIKGADRKKEGKLWTQKEKEESTYKEKHEK